MNKPNTQKKSISGKSKALRFAFSFLSDILCTAALFALPVSAEGAPSGVNTANLDALVNIVFWAVRIIILAVGGIPALIKAVQGHADVNPRDFNSGISTLIVTGVIFAATFAIETMF